MMSSNPVVVETPLVDVEEPVPRDSVRVSWGSIIAGLVVALGAWLLLSVLGLAIGLSSVDPANPGTLRSGGMVSGIWSLIVPFVALLVGGLVAARTAGIVSRPTGAIHGVVLWALATLASLMLVGYVVRGVMNAAMGADIDLSGATGGIVPPPPSHGGAQMRTLEIDSSDLIGPVNARLRAEGKPPVTTGEIDETLKDVASSGIRGGRLDHEMFVTSLSRNTGLNRVDAEDIAARVDASISTRGDEVRRDMQTGAAKAADATGKAMWWVFIGMLLGLGSAVVGSTLGVSRRQRLAASPHHHHGPAIATAGPSHW